MINLDYIILCLILAIKSHAKAKHICNSLKSTLALKLQKSMLCQRKKTERMKERQQRTLYIRNGG